MILEIIILIIMSIAAIGSIIFAIKMRRSRIKLEKEVKEIIEEQTKLFDDRLLKIMIVQAEHEEIMKKLRELENNLKRGNSKQDDDSQE